MGQFAIQFGDRFPSSARWRRKAKQETTPSRNCLHKIS